MSAATLLLLGAGGLAREVLAAMRRTQAYRILGFLDDDAALHSTMVDGLPVLGGLSDAADHPRCSFLACAGSGAARAGMVQTLSRTGVAEDRFATFVDPGAHLTEGCTVGAGSIIGEGSFIGDGVRIPADTKIAPNSSVESGAAVFAENL